MYTVLVYVIININNKIIIVNVLIIEASNVIYRYDCDQFTRYYYKEKLNMEQPQSISVERPPPQPVKPVRQVTQST